MTSALAVGVSAATLAYSRARQDARLSVTHEERTDWLREFALKHGEHFMSTSMVALSRACAITRPASRARWQCRGVVRSLSHLPSEISILYNIYISSIEIIGLKSKHLLVKQIK